MTYKAARLLCITAQNHLCHSRIVEADACLTEAPKVLEGMDAGDLLGLLIVCRDDLEFGRIQKCAALLPVAIELLSGRIEPTKDLPGLGEIGERAEKARIAGEAAKGLAALNTERIEKLNKRLVALEALQAEEAAMAFSHLIQTDDRLDKLEATQIRVPVALPHPEGPTPEPEEEPLKEGDVVWVDEVGEHAWHDWFPSGAVCDVRSVPGGDNLKAVTRCETEFGCEINADMSPWSDDRPIFTRTPPADHT